MEKCSQIKAKRQHEGKRLKRHHVFGSFRHVLLHDDEYKQQTGYLTLKVSLLDINYEYINKKSATKEEAAALVLHYERKQSQNKLLLNLKFTAIYIET